MKNTKEKCDMRIIKTHDKLRYAFGDLMRKKTFEDISVIEICEAADVRRATFYRHFTDKNAFLISAVERVAAELAELAAEKYGKDDLTKYIVGYVREIFIYISDKKDIVENIFKSRGSSNFHEVILAATQKLLVENLLDGEKNGIFISDSKAAAAAFINGGVANMVASFIKNKDVNTGALLRELSMILDKLFLVD